MTGSYNHERELEWYGVVIVLAAVAFAVDILTGTYSHSLTLFTDAGHVLFHSLALGIALLIAWQRADVTTLEDLENRTKGRRRIAVLLLGMAGAVGTLAIVRFFHATEVEGSHMLLGGLAGAAINLLQWLILRRCHCELHHALSVHMRSDLYLSLAAAAGAAVLWLSDLSWIDSVVTLGVCVIVARDAYQLRHGHHHQH